MNRQDHRNRQQGGSQQEAYSQASRQQGGNDPSRQHQGDFGARDQGYPTGGRDDWRREQDNRSGYQDDQGWRSASEQNRYGPRYSGGSRDLDDGGYDRNRSDRPSGLDRDYRGAGYAGPGGYGGGYGGQDIGEGRGQYGTGARGNQQFDPDYDQWRREQVRALDDDYHQWREDRFKKFSDEFSTWRASRAQRTGAGTGDKSEAGTTPAKPNKDSNS